MLELAAELGDPGGDPATIGLELGLTGTTAADTAALHPDTSTGLAGQVAAPAAEALLEVVELGELDLRLALLGAGVLGEDVEDQRGPVDHLDLDLVLEVAQLRRAELAVADDGVGAGVAHDHPQVVDLARSDVGRRVGLLAALREGVEHLRARCLGEQLELGQRVVGVLDGALGPDPDEHDTLESQLAVLDLGDVLELGREPGDPAQSMALLELVVALAALRVRAIGVEERVLAVGAPVALVQRGVRVAVDRGGGEEVALQLDVAAFVEAVAVVRLVGILTFVHCHRGSTVRRSASRPRTV